MNGNGDTVRYYPRIMRAAGLAYYQKYAPRLVKGAPASMLSR